MESIEFCSLISLCFYRIHQFDDRKPHRKGYGCGIIGNEMISSNEKM